MGDGAATSLNSLILSGSKDGLKEYLVNTGLNQGTADNRNQWFEDFGRIRKYGGSLFSLDELLDIVDEIIAACPDARNALFQKAVVLSDKGEFQDALDILNAIIPGLTGGKRGALLLKLHLLKRLDADTMEFTHTIADLEGL